MSKWPEHRCPQCGTINTRLAEVEEYAGPRFSMEDALLEDCDRLRQKIWKMGEALKAADSFITNGVELGYIRMPDKDCPDPAHAVPGLIREALSFVPPEVAPRVEQFPTVVHRADCRWLKAYGGPDSFAVTQCTIGVCPGCGATADSTPEERR